MTKLQTAFASLTAVVPAAILAYVIITGMMSNLNAITGLMPLMAATVLALICCLAVVFVPALVFVVGDGGGEDFEVEEAAQDAPTSTAGSDEFDEFGEFDEDDEGAETLVSDDFDMDETQDFDGDEDWGDDEWDDDEDWDEKA